MMIGGVEPANDLFVMVDDLLEAEALERRRVATRLFRTLDTGPARRDGVEAAVRVVKPTVPAVRCHPHAVDEHDGFLCHGPSSRLECRLDNSPTAGLIPSLVSGADEGRDLLLPRLRRL